MNEFLTILGLGAGVMYFFDPVLGRRRRAMVRDRLFSSSKDERGVVRSQENEETDPQQ